MNESIYNTLAEMLSVMHSDRVDYETEHVDAGNNYAMLIGEGDWIYHNGDDRLREYLESQNLSLTDDEIEDLTWELINDCEPTPGHVFSTVSSNEFEVASFPVGEVEDQYSFDDLVEQWELPLKVIKEFAEELKDDNDFCARVSDYDILLYTSTDAIWQFKVDKDWILDRLPDERKEELSA